MMKKICEGEWGALFYSDTNAVYGVTHPQGSWPFVVRPINPKARHWLWRLFFGREDMFGRKTVATLEQAIDECLAVLQREHADSERHRQRFETAAHSARVLAVARAGQTEEET